MYATVIALRLERLGVQNDILACTEQQTHHHFEAFEQMTSAKLSGYYVGICGQ